MNRNRRPRTAQARRRRRALLPPLRIPPHRGPYAPELLELAAHDFMQLVSRVAHRVLRLHSHEVGAGEVGIASLADTRGGYSFRVVRACDAPDFARFDEGPIFVLDPRGYGLWAGYGTRERARKRGAA
jgi:hypothetical protein